MSTESKAKAACGLNFKPERVLEGNPSVLVKDLGLFGGKYDSDAMGTPTWAGARLVNGLEPVPVEICSHCAF